MNNKTPSLIEQNIRSALESPNFLALLNNITGMNLTKLSTLFMSKYRSGHFLSPHSDKGNGRLAFVISLSKDWMPQYGGLLHFLSQDRTQIINTVCPIFNNMVIFKVDDIENKVKTVPYKIESIQYRLYNKTGIYLYTPYETVIANKREPVITNTNPNTTPIIVKQKQVSNS